MKSLILILTCSYYSFGYLGTRSNVKKPIFSGAVKLRR